MSDRAKVLFRICHLTMISLFFWDFDAPGCWGSLYILSKWITQNIDQPLKSTSINTNNNNKNDNKQWHPATRNPIHFLQFCFLFHWIFSFFTRIGTQCDLCLIRFNGRSFNLYDTSNMSNELIANFEKERKREGGRERKKWQFT